MQNVTIFKTRIGTYLRWLAIVLILVLLRNISSAQSGPIRINEFLASNSTGSIDFEFDYSDWIELYNDSDNDISLLNWAITDDTLDTEKWLFPDVTIPAKGFLKIFASGKDITNMAEMHTNFKLSSGGEYLGLYNELGEGMHEFYPEYPSQSEDITYGYINGEYAKIASATPGYSNESSHKYNLIAPGFSVPRGFYNEGFDLQLEKEEGTNLYYTLDGSAPTLSNGILYTGPISIETTTIVRASTFDEDGNESTITTNSYIFVNDVIHQPNDPEGYPARWGPYVDRNGNAIADYEMDPELIEDAAFAQEVIKGLQSLPTISISTDLDNLFSNERNDDRGGIYIYTGPPESGDVPGYGIGWERPISFEYIDEEGNVFLQEDCGIRLQGGHSRRSEKSPKHSFRLAFRSKYGASKLDFPFFGDEGAKKFNGLALKAGFGNTWFHHSSSERNRAQYVRDIWGKDTQRAMGHNSAQAKHVNLYINGIYWGLYHVTERLDKSYADSYLEGGEDDFDVVKDGGNPSNVVDGEFDLWEKLQAKANARIENDQDYYELMGLNSDGTPNKDIDALIDMDNFIDYMMINLYGGNTDWDHHNWAAINNREHKGRGFQFFSWDAEHILKSVNENVIFENNNGNPSRIYRRLREHNSFARRFADRAHKHFNNGGVMSVDNGRNRWVSRTHIIEDAVNAESARWGDYRRDVHRNQPQGPFTLYTKEEHWLPQLEFMKNTYFPQRWGTFFGQLRNVNLYSTVNGPLFEVDGHEGMTDIIQGGEMLEIRSNVGSIYYTLDGSDPVKWSSSNTFAGEKADNALTYNGAITLDNSIHIIARVCNNGICSAAAEIALTKMSDLEDLRITEIHYHPGENENESSDDFEFVEIKNVGTKGLNLKGLIFTEGIDYTFEKDAFIDPQGFIVLASSTKYFYDRYGFMPHDRYKGSLNNGGEQITLSDPARMAIVDISFDDEGEWPIEADGDGFSLVPTDVNPEADQRSGATWRNSYKSGGSPGKDDIKSTAIEEENQSELVMLDNSPNPFSDATEIKFEVGVSGNVSLNIYNNSGQLIEKLIKQENYKAGSYNINWTPKTSLSTGVYICHLIVESKNALTKEVSRKLIKVN